MSAPPRPVPPAPLPARPPGPPGYWAATRTATYGFWAALPLLVLYEALIVVTNPGPTAIRVGADVWLKTLLAAVGGVGWHALGVVVLGIGLLIWLRERKKNIPLRAGWFGGIVAESAVYAVVLAGLVGGLVGWVLNVALLGQPAGLTLGQELALSLGAGLYEELVFRVLLVGGLAWALRWVWRSRAGAYVAAALVGAFVFSLVHYLGPLGDPFRLDSFLFRFLFGLALNAVFLIRGFGVAAWTHALYDVWVFLLRA